LPVFKVLRTIVLNLHPTRDNNVDFISNYGVVCCLDVYEEMMSLDVLIDSFKDLAPVQKVDLLLMYVRDRNSNW
jgi:hypothetical protein